MVAGPEKMLAFFFDLGEHKQALEGLETRGGVFGRTRDRPWRAALGLYDRLVCVPIDMSGSL